MSWFIRLRDSWITLCQDTPKTRLGNQCEFVGYNCRTQVFQVDYVFLFQRMFFFFFVGWVSNWNSSCFPKLWLSSSRLSIGDPDHGYVKAVVDAICMAKWPSKSMRSLHEAPGFSTLWMKTLFPFFQLGFCIFFFGEILESQFPIPEVGMFFLFFLQKHSSKALGDFWGVFIGASKELFFFSSSSWL